MANVQIASGIALHFEGCTVSVETENQALVDKLRRYFGDFAAEPGPDDRPRTRLLLFEEATSEAEEGLVPWMDKGKDAFLDLPRGRLVRKLRTGVSIVIEEDHWSSVWTMRGRLGRNFSQVVNAIGNIYGLHLMDRGGAMIHASAVADGAGQVLAVMAQSGMGKSSVAVRLMELGFDFVSNDRVILETPLTDDGVRAHGLPKLPRVNPGTLLDGASTRKLLDPAARRRYETLPREELWRVEEKYDLEVNRILGRRWLLGGDIRAALVLSWRHEGEGLRFERLTPDQALAELKQVSKDFGVFDLRLVSRSQAALAEASRRLSFYRVLGRADPARLAQELAKGALAEFAQ